MITDYDLFDIEQEKKIARRPICSCCEQPIQDEVGYYIENKWYCPECMSDTFERDLESEFDEE